MTFFIYPPNHPPIDIDSLAGQAEIGRQHIEWLRRTGLNLPAEHHKEKIMKFVERARKAYEKQEKRQQEDIARRQLQIEAEITKKIAAWDLTETPQIKGNIVKFEGVTLRYLSGHHNYRACWQMQGICPKCGETVWSNNLYDASEFGRCLLEFKPDYSHYCSNNTSDDAPEALLISVIKSLIEEVINDQ